jgi:hypothetical protein
MLFARDEGKKNGGKTNCLKKVFEALKSAAIPS